MSTDPALVAASGGAAAALISASNPALAAATSAAPATSATGGLPIITGAPAVDENSRYADVGVAVYVDAGTEIVFLRRRFVPQPEVLATTGWQLVGPGDRIDVVAGRALADPTAFWRLCDANLAFDPAELEESGRMVRVTLPEGFPGAPSMGHG